MTKTLATFDATGAITCVCTVSDDTANDPYYKDAIEIASGAQVTYLTHYVTSGAVTPRPANTATLDGTALNNLPSPCSIVINNTTYACTDASAQLNLPAGQYNITVIAFPLVNAQFQVTV